LFTHRAVWCSTARLGDSALRGADGQLGRDRGVSQVRPLIFDQIGRLRSDGTQCPFCAIHLSPSPGWPWERSWERSQSRYDPESAASRRMSKMFRQDALTRRSPNATAGSAGDAIRGPLEPSLRSGPRAMCSLVAMQRSGMRARATSVVNEGGEARSRSLREQNRCVLFGLIQRPLVPRSRQVTDAERRRTRRGDACRHDQRDHGEDDRQRGRRTAGTHSFTVLHGLHFNRPSSRLPQGCGVPESWTAVESSTWTRT